MNSKLIAAALAAFAWQAANAEYAIKETKATGEAVKVDREADTVTLRDHAGLMTTVKVPTEVRNLDMVDRGQILAVHYQMAQAQDIGPAESQPAVEGQELRDVPASTTAAEPTPATRRATGKIRNIDRSRREMRLQMPGRESIRLQVPENTPGYDSAKVGDEVVVRYTEPVATSVFRQDADTDQWHWLYRS